MPHCMAIFQRKSPPTQLNQFLSSFTPFYGIWYDAALISHEIIFINFAMTTTTTTNNNND